MPDGSHIKVAASGSPASWLRLVLDFRVPGLCQGGLGLGGPDSPISALSSFAPTPVPVPASCSLLRAPGTPVGPGPIPREAGEGCPALLLAGPGEPRHLLSLSSVPFRSLLWALFVPRMFVLGPEAPDSLVGLARSEAHLPAESCTAGRPRSLGLGASRLGALAGGAQLPWQCARGGGSARW